MQTKAPWTDAWKGHDDELPLIRQGHLTCITQSAQLTKMSVAEFISPRRIIGVLRKRRVPLVLVGQYGFDGWLQEARQCAIVEILIRPRSCCTTLRVLTAAFKALRWQKTGSLVEFIHRKSGKRRISVRLAEEPIELAVFDHSLRIGVSPILNYRVPTLEMALALRFASMTQLPWGDADKYFHAAQFLRMAKVNPAVDWTSLREIGDLIGPHIGRELVKNVRDRQAGKPFQL